MTKMIKLVFIILVMHLSFNINAKAQTNLIPKPQEINLKNNVIEFNSLAIVANNEFENEVKLFKDFLSEKGMGEHHSNSVQLSIQKGEVKNPHGFDGAYKLAVSNRIVLQATSTQGVFYGLQTLKQLIEKKGNKFNIPECEINDWPAFKIRGFMHDVGRNYISIERLKQQPFMP